MKFILILLKISLFIIKILIKNIYLDLLILILFY